MHAELIYLDHAATTPLHPQALAAMLPYLRDQFGNPSSRHAFAEGPRQALDWARAELARALGCRIGEVVFTAGGSEGNSLAIVGSFLAMRHERRHLITSAVEHHAVLHACEYLAQEQGAELTVLPVDSAGRVDPGAVADAIRPDTALVSLMYANNEIGTLQPVAAVGAICRERGVFFHCDAVQAAGLLPLDVVALQVDLLTLSAHKCYGPKGVGALYVRRGIPLRPLVHGGGQERGRRAGTEHVAGIVGFAVALALAEQARPNVVAELTLLRDQLLAGVLEGVPGARLTGHARERLANSASFCFEGVEGEAVLLGLEEAGVACSSGSACAAGSSEPSHVLLALGLEPDLARTAVRLSLGTGTSAAQVAYVLDVLPKVVERLRATC
jgi:cysteine desulfurase